MLLSEFIIIVVGLSSVHATTGKKSCPTITINNGNIQEKRRNIFNIICNPGFSLIGPRNIRCLQNGKFNFYRQPKCILKDKKKSCSKLKIANANVREVIHGGGRRVFNVVTCKTGFKRIGRPHLLCNSGQFRGRIPICKRNRCPDPGTPVNGIKFGDYKVGSKIRFLCNQGFRLIGSQERTCLYNWKWSLFQPSCVKKSNILEVARELKENFIDKVGLFTNTSKGSNATGRGLVSGTRGLDITFLIDRSSSIDETDFQHGLNFTKYIVRELGISNKKGGTRVAIVTFGTRARIDLTINDETVTTTEDVLQKLDTIKASGGGTNVKEAFELISLDLLPLLNSEAKKVIFMISDGRSNTGHPGALAKALRKDNDFEIFAVGIGNGVDRKQLSTIASHPYTSHVFLLKDYESLTILTEGIVGNTTDYRKCGVSGNIEMKGATGRSVGGGESNPGAWPWLAAIYRGTDTGSQLECGGALICDNWILTAAHCLEKRNDTHFAKLEPHEIEGVWLGEHDRRLREGPEQVRLPVEVVQHPQYNFQTHAYDIGLLRLDPYAPAIVNKWVRTVCLPSLDDGTSLVVKRPNSKGYVAGWGTTSKSNTGDDKYNPSFKLKQVKLSVVDQNSCKDTLRYFREELKEHMFCAGFRHVRIGTCRGDTGGPFVGQRDDFRFTALGIVSWKEGCAASGRYGIYTSIADFMPWINQVTGNCNAKYE